ncbi:hypothetical protein JCM1840_007628 [Sporobolomyces johnsonii]
MGQTPQASTSAPEVSTATAGSVYANFADETLTLTLGPDVCDNTFRTTNPHTIHPDGVAHLPDEPDLNVHEIPPGTRRRGAPAEEVASDEEMQDATPRHSAATMQMIRDADKAEQHSREARDPEDTLHAQQAAVLITQQQAEAAQYRSAAQAAQQTALAQAATLRAQAAHVPATVLHPFPALPPLAPDATHYAQCMAAEMRQQEAVAQADTLRAQAAAAPAAYRQDLPPPPPAPLQHAAPIPLEYEIEIEGDWYHSDQIPDWLGVFPLNQETVNMYIFDTNYHTVTGHRREGQHLWLFVLGPERDTESHFAKHQMDMFDMLLQASRSFMANAASTSRVPARRYEDDSDDDARSHRSRR